MSRVIKGSYSPSTSRKCRRSNRKALRTLPGSLHPWHSEDCLASAIKRASTRPSDPPIDRCTLGTLSQGRKFPLGLRPAVVVTAGPSSGFGFSQPSRRPKGRVLTNRVLQENARLCTRQEQSMSSQGKFSKWPLAPPSLIRRPQQETQ